MSEATIDLVCDKERYPFWNDTLCAWSHLNNKNEEVDAQFLWYKDNIKINKEPIFWKKCYKDGLKWVSQLFPNGELISAKEAKQLFKLEILELNQLCSAIPRKWIYQLKNGQNCCNVSKYDELINRKNLARYAYNQLIENESPAIKLISRWANDLGTTSEEITDDFYQQLKAIMSVSNVPKFRSFQYRLLNRALIFKSHLHRWNITEDDKCTLCGEKRKGLLTPSVCVCVSH